ncbi:MAG: FG-GAP-like repeat-containing protein, partial [Chromatiales bacterium]
ARRAFAANHVFKNNGSGGFTDTGQALGLYNSWGAALGDLDDDGDVDAFVANAGEPNRVWLNDGAGNYADSGMELGAENSFAVALGDLDGDRDLDAFVANSGNDTVWINSSAPAAIQSDVDGDGVQDVNDPCPADPLDECEQNGSSAEEIAQDDGGSLATPDGQLEIVVEAGDVSEDTVISATESVIADPQVDLSIGTAGGQALAIYDLEPDGLTFDNPVTLTLELDVSALDPLQRTQLDIYRQEDLDGDGTPETFVGLGATCSVTQPGVDTFIASCSVELDHFSTYAMVAPLDSDGDGVPNNFNGYIDACPSEDATGFDVDDNGCIDSFSGLIDLVSALVSEGVIDANMRNSLTSKVDNAQSSADREKVCTAVNELRAFQAQVAAQTGKKISAEAANLVTDYADSIIAYLLNKLAAGISC